LDREYPESSGLSTPELSPQAIADPLFQDPLDSLGFSLPPSALTSTEQAPPTRVSTGYPACKRIRFALRRADNIELGLVVDRTSDDKVLLVQFVIPGGAVESWNRQVIYSAKTEKTVFHGDLIVDINGQTTCDGMLAEIKSKLLLKIELIRRSRTHEII
jgi:hypothetical protein